MKCIKHLEKLPEFHSVMRFVNRGDDGVCLACFIWTDLSP